MIQYQLLSGLLHLIIFFMGAAIGSFLNVVIYRLPRDLSVNEPKRSFCPVCKRQIPWYENIPLVSWLMLRGRCSNPECRTRISARYIGVEFLTGVLFYALFWRFGGDWRDVVEWGPLVACLWVFVSLLIAGTFIDIEHFILPHEITIGGAVAGLIAAAAVPELVQETTHLRGFLVSLASGALGLGGLWLVVELGKLAFGKKNYVFNKPEDWSVTQPDEEQPPVFTVEGTEYSWADLYFRPTDRLVVACEEVRINDRSWSKATVELWEEKLVVRTAESSEIAAEVAIADWKLVEGTTSRVTIPREAMGFGDVLLLMMIGTFLGWKAVLFTILAASVLGTLLAGFWRLIGRSEWSAKIPFGPYLAAGAVLWLFIGQQIMHWYLGKVMGTSAFQGIVLMDL